MSRPRKPSNQELRTRKDLLLAASRLMKQGRTPTMEDVAEEALVSRATAYRHFPKIDALLVEAPLDAAVADPEELFANDLSDDVEERIDRAEASLHTMVYQNEAQLRILLANAIRRGQTDAAIPVRQNRRLPLIKAALAPARARLADADYERLCAALAIIFGAESMIVFRDVLGIDPDTARAVKRWAVRALVRSALQEATGSTAE
ncbi:MAG: TetR/AcrR family transcriptional regulator [Candidatus Competibacteraceae bacterium]|nr:TetR/AcrR family transcriptional regulator [Candidatus Competibacteraceae bacterium]